MNEIVNKLQSSDTALDVKVGFLAGDYELEECIYECLELLHSFNESQHIKTESIMIFLHDVS